MTQKLNPGESFPELVIPLHGGGEITLSDAGDASYQIVLFYRGSF